LSESLAGMRRPRADAARNRRRLTEAAKAVFTERGADAALEDIASRAEVGIGTLYRNFPTREALLAEVYHHAFEQLAAAAAEISSTLPPLDALRAWLRLFVDYIATKQVILPALNASGSLPAASTSGPTVMSIMADLTERAAATGEIVLNVEPVDLLRALMGVANVNNGPGWQASALRLIDILVDGMRNPGR
jgi:AcrR family transcriptional regulator